MKRSELMLLTQLRIKESKVLLDSNCFAGAYYLDEHMFYVQASFWIYLSEASRWRLMIATPAFVRFGPRRAYQQLQRVLARKPLLNILLEDIALIEPGHDLVKQLSKIVTTGRTVVGIRFSGNTIGKHYIQDAYIYRLLRSQNPSL